MKGFFKSYCVGKTSAEEIKNAIENTSLRNIDIIPESSDGTDTASEYFGDEDFSTTTDEDFFIYLPPSEDSNVILDQNGEIYAREETEVHVTIFLHRNEDGRSLYTYTICVCGERIY